ncbi:DUF3089 domain-containing protein [Halioglobus maricola]|uniref:DUF3089 domain-containing protein n=1 Tax=Halioglobus maricola TaxID=2601894 RepID=A0A5P9NJQ3_9GAMM|nr:DUF3089 domain-containing protein [Halioglobus maricola]QFU75809.1 DUF3089 domain-containing protein [Halioglobus maricola]
MNQFSLKILLLAGLAAIAGCSDSDRREREPGPYATDDMWLCKPGIADDRCLAIDLKTTWVYGNDDSRAVFEHEVAQDPEFDCFYVYPTQDFSEEPGNTEDLTDLGYLDRAIANQAARFNSLCAVYTPKYHQMTIATYGLDNVRDSEFFARALNDVEAAFDQYLLENPGRNFVLMGHSQGSHMLLAMMQNRIDRDPAVRARMISALLVGPTGMLQVPAGEVVGGSLENIPLCEQAAQTGCIVAYDSMAAGNADARPVPDAPRPCVNPTLLGGEPGQLAGTMYNADEGFPFPEGVDTYWVAFPDHYTAACEPDGFLGIGVAQGAEPAVPPSVVELFLGGSLHSADFNYPIVDLLRIVETQGRNH